MGSPPKRNHHEAKHELVTGPEGAHEPSSRAHPKWRVGNRERRPWPRADTTEAVKLTGQWRHEKELYHLFINQAGPHIELLLALVENGYSKKLPDSPVDAYRNLTRLFRFGGDVDATERRLYHLYAHHPDGPLGPKDLRCGTLLRTHKTKITLEFDLSNFEPDSPTLAKLAPIARSRATRLGTSPNLFEDHLAKSWVPVDVRTTHWFPLTPTQRKRLGAFIFDVRIELDSNNYLQHDKKKPREYSYIELVERYFEIQGPVDHGQSLVEILEKIVSRQKHLTAQERQWLRNIASALDRLVWKAYQAALEAKVWKGGIDQFGAQDWRLLTLAALDSKTLAIGGGLACSLLTHTRAVLDGSKDADLGQFEKLLHLQPRSGGHYYEGELELVDVSGAFSDSDKALKKVLKRALKNLEKVQKKLKKLPFGSYAGTLTVKKPDDGAFEQTYVILLAGVKLDRSVGVSTQVVRSKGKAENVYGQPWRAEHIPGRAAFIDLGGAYVFNEGAGKGASWTMLRCYGSGTTKPPTPLSFNFSGLSDLLSPGVGMGGSFSRYTGEIFAPDAYGDVDLGVSASDVVVEYGVHPGRLTLHFPINGAGLLPGACETLEVFAACQLAVLARKGVQLVLHGYADQPHDEVSNAILSRNRCVSAFNYLKNILEDDLAAPDLKEVPEDEKEEEEQIKEIKAKDESVPDDFVLEVSNDQVKVEPHGEKMTPSGADGKEEYNSVYRRVDLFVNGSIYLSLRRE